MSTKPFLGLSRGTQVRMAALYVYNTRHGYRFVGNLTPAMQVLAAAFERLDDQALRLITCHR